MKITKGTREVVFVLFRLPFVPFVYVPDFLGKAAKPTQSFSSLVRFPPRIISFWSDRKSTRLNSSHLVISYAVFCLKKKKKKNIAWLRIVRTHFKSVTIIVRA